ncbi:biopolymer transporter ExbD [Labrenzia suaedae]|uniref:Biopolymer transporter ExbD n=2 Tax=Roseibium litorale TaxID=2803841 RepID=A0ABR9CGL0_9HYPH|nr:biopolymer transporter ExbD [Roseibium litorale]
MHINMPRARARKLSLTSLIDVIFLLLLFFMLTSTFTRFGEIDIAAPGGQSSGGGKGPDAILALDDNGLLLNGLPIQADGLTGALADLQEKGAKSILLIPRGTSTAQDLVTALEQVRRIEGLTVTVAR